MYMLCDPECAVGDFESVDALQPPVVFQTKRSLASMFPSATKFSALQLHTPPSSQTPSTTPRPHCVLVVQAAPGISPLTQTRAPVLQVAVPPQSVSYEHKLPAGTVPPTVQVPTEQYVVEQSLLMPQGWPLLVPPTHIFGASWQYHWHPTLL